jgi:hypothetical protein
MKDCHLNHIAILIMAKNINPISIKKSLGKEGLSQHVNRIKPPEHGKSIVIIVGGAQPTPSRGRTRLQYSLVRGAHRSKPPRLH